MHDDFSIKGKNKIPFADMCRSDPKYRKYFMQKTYSASQCVYQRGAKINKFGIVAEGMLKAADHTSEGVELCHAYFEAQDIFPEFLYFSGERYYTYSLYAEKKSTVEWVPVDVLEEMLRENMDLMYALLIYISQRGLKNQMYLHCLNYQTIRQRLAYWLIGMNNLSLGEAISMPCSQTVLANMLHVSRSSLNQELKQMEREGLFHLKKREIAEVNIERLRTIL